MHTSDKHPEKYALAGGPIFDGAGFLFEQAIVISGERITGCLKENDLPADIPVINVGGATIAPGLIDLQINGCGGVMFNDASTVQTLAHMHTVNLASGCTSFLPTLVTTCDAEMLRAMEAVGAYRSDHGHENVLGLHLEGPYINRARKGIHNERYIRRLSPSMRNALCSYAQKVPLVLTLAPECVDHSDIRLLAEAGVLVSIGHSDASYQEATEGIRAGAKTASHLFNAMSQWQSREPGVVGAIFDSPDLACGLIADGRHSHFTSIRLAKRLKKDRCFLVTDATAAAGSQITEFNFCGQRVYVREGKCVNADGTLGGSNLTMLLAVENCVRHVGISLEESLRMASQYPARVMRQEKTLGTIASGLCANLIVFNPEHFDLLATIDRGKPYFWT